MLIEKHGEIEEKGIQDILKAWFMSKDWEEPTPTSVARVLEYIRSLEKKLDLLQKPCENKNRRNE